MIELERTFLAKQNPLPLESESKEMLDIYLPKSAGHPTLRIRKNGNSHEMTKKEPVKKDASVQKEHTIPLTKEEFEELEKTVEGKRIRKARHTAILAGRKCEIDLFKEMLEGLVLIDFEFESEEEKEEFEMPDFCLADVTRETFIAGGMLCGKSYEDIKDKLKKFGYNKIRRSESDKHV